MILKHTSSCGCPPRFSSSLRDLFDVGIKKASRVRFLDMASEVYL